MNMDVPIALGISLAYAMSLYETINHGEHAYFDASVSLLFFLLIGRTLDHVMRERARAAVTGLSRLAPRGAMVVRDDGSRDYLPIAEIIPGMGVLVAAGERIPVDGEVVSGSSDLDCCDRQRRKRAASASGRVRRCGPACSTSASPLTMRATAAARRLLPRRDGAADGGGRGRPRPLPAHRRPGRALYSPVVHLTALATFIGWMVAAGDWHQALTIAIAVLIITCPCALGLAVPIVQVVAARRLFERGIMVKDGSAMERLAEIDTVVFDKTGTLTTGAPLLSNANAIEAGALATAAAIAAHSRHPLSVALVEAAGGRLADTARVRPHFGDPGARPRSDAQRRGLPARPRRLGAGDGRRAAPRRRFDVLARNGQLVAAFTFADRLRPDAAGAIAALKGQGRRRARVRRRAEPVAARRRLSIDRFWRGVPPAARWSGIAALAAAGRKVLMVGDGLNDMPALAAAHVSMAPATAADSGATRPTSSSCATAFRPFRWRSTFARAAG